MYSSFTVSLPIADRGVAFRFYRDGLGLEPFGEPADDGYPEPLQFVVAPGVRIMLVPTGGLGWTVGDNAVATPGTTEALMSVAVLDRESVDASARRASAHGGTVISTPRRQPWGYEGVIADPDGHLWMIVEGEDPARV